MENNKLSPYLGWPVAVGLFLSALILGYAVGQFKNADRFVSVKGLSEREVTADLVIWPIGYKDASADVATLHERLSQKNAAIVNFLKTHGFEDSEIIVSAPNVIDVQAENYAGANVGARFKATALVTVRSTKVEKAIKAMSETSVLLKSGIALFREEWANKTEFLYTKLNDIKPAMIEEATKNARQAADKFAQDSGAHVGRIRRATQGLFSIEEFDKSSPQLKRVRVVTTVDYFLD